MSNIVITWPQTRPLVSYLAECNRAVLDHKSINFRVSARPKNVDVGDRCYVVYAGVVRCWHKVIGLAYRAERQVFDPMTGEYWPAGNYIVRDPDTVLLAGPPRRMAGFQGFRYYDE